MTVAVAVMLLSVAPTAAMAANVSLHSAHVGAQSATFHAESDDGGLTAPVVWHFVLNGLDRNTPSGRLTVTFRDAGTLTATGRPVGKGATQHFYVGTSAHDTLVSATATVDSEKHGRLVLSHVVVRVTPPADDPPADDPPADDPPADDPPADDPPADDPPADDPPADDPPADDPPADDPPADDPPADDPPADDPPADDPPADDPPADDPPADDPPADDPPADDPPADDPPADDPPADDPPADDPPADDPPADDPPADDPPADDPPADDPPADDPPADDPFLPFTEEVVEEAQETEEFLPYTGAEALPALALVVFFTLLGMGLRMSAVPAVEKVRSERR